MSTRKKGKKIDKGGTYTSRVGLNNLTHGLVVKHYIRHGYYAYERLHRIDGPAIDCKESEKDSKYYINGTELTYTEYIEHPETRVWRNKNRGKIINKLLKRK